MDRGEASDTGIESRGFPDGTGNARTSEIRRKVTSEVHPEDAHDAPAPIAELFDEATRIDYHTFDQFHGVARGESSSTASQGSWRPPPPSSLRTINRVKKPALNSTASSPTTKRASLSSAPPPPPERSFTPRNAVRPPPMAQVETPWLEEDIEITPLPELGLKPMPATVTALLARSELTPQPLGVANSVLHEISLRHPPPPESPPPIQLGEAEVVTPEPSRAVSALSTRPWPEIPPPRRPWEDFRDRALSVLARNLRVLADQLETFL